MNPKPKKTLPRRLPTKDSMYAFYLADPVSKAIERELDRTRLRYSYLDSELRCKTQSKEVLNGCLLSGKAILEYGGSSSDLGRFDMFFIPPEKTLRIKPQESETRSKICFVSSPSVRKVDADFEIQRFGFDKFTHQGEIGSDRKMSTYRTNWTAIKNGFFMSGFTQIPDYSLKQGVVTSVNLEKDKEGELEISSHIHPNIPEVHIYCISDKKTAVTQYLISPEGSSICRDLTDGEGAFFPGNLGHMNFVRPTYRNVAYCLYMWVMPTYGKTDYVKPVPLNT
ncbi:MAG: hypothetical protein WED05_06580 [Candidatus Atabeyarchaeum deiterrae]